VYRRVLPTVEPGYLRPLIPEEAPECPEQWQDVMKDIERVIMPGVIINLFYLIIIIIILTKLKTMLVFIKTVSRR
jgi:hypothetical protein